MTLPNMTAQLLMRTSLMLRSLCRSRANTGFLLNAGLSLAVVSTSLLLQFLESERLFANKRGPCFIPHTFTRWWCAMRLDSFSFSLLLVDSLMLCALLGSKHGSITSVSYLSNCLNLILPWWYYKWMYCMNMWANPLFLIQIELTLFPMLLQWKFTWRKYPSSLG